MAINFLAESIETSDKSRPIMIGELQSWFDCWRIWSSWTNYTRSKFGRQCCWLYEQCNERYSYFFYYSSKFNCYLAQRWKSWLPWNWSVWCVTFSCQVFWCNESSPKFGCEQYQWSIKLGKNLDDTDFSSADISLPMKNWIQYYNLDPKQAAAFTVICSSFMLSYLNDPTVVKYGSNVEKENNESFVGKRGEI